MNEDEVVAFACQWEIETSDVRRLVAERLSADQSLEGVLVRILDEMGELRRELAALRDSNESLCAEMVRLRIEASSHRAPRISPFSPSEASARLS